MFRLADEQFESARAALLGPGATDLIDFIHGLKLGRGKDGASEAAVGAAVSLGWYDPATGALTELGDLVGDPIREYRFWIERDRRLHAEHCCQLLAPESYVGKDVLEPGSGFGCNLFTLAPHARSVVGLEPVPLYAQFSAIFAEREGLEVPRVVIGTAEKMPFEDDRFDVVLMYSAHQYMCIRSAFREIARVLRPGGQLQVIGGTLDNYRLVERDRNRSYWLTVVNTLTYERIGRRLWTPGGASATTAPIYPRPRHLDRWLVAAGLRPRPELRMAIDTETLTVADKPA